MLGWELPPDSTGGLGTACLGLTRGLAQQDVDVVFVHPRRGAGAEPELTRITYGADEARAAHVAQTARFPQLARIARLAPGPGDVVLRPATGAGPGYARGDRLPPNRLHYLPVDSPLSPYLGAGEYAELLAEIRAQADGPDPGPAAAIEDERGARDAYAGALRDEVERYAGAVERLAREERFDLVHAHDWMTFPAGLRVRARADRPLVCHVHACEYDRNGAAADPAIVRIEQLGFSAADLVVPVSHYTSSVLRERYALDPRRIRVVHNGVTAPEPGNAPSPVPDAAPLVLFLGRMTSQKAPERFLAAADLAARAEPELRFAMCGAGELLEPMRRLAAELGLADRVSFPGFVRGAALEQVFAAATLLVMPSRSEPFGLAGLEALVRGIPVIVPERCGVAEVSDSSLKVDSAVVEDLADKILAVVRRPELRRRLGEDGRAEARACTWDRSASAVTRVYRELVG